MSGRYAYTGGNYEEVVPLGNAILVQEQIWNENDSNVSETMQFTNTAASPLSDPINNETYMTAQGDPTQYFSILETSNETMLNDIAGNSLETSSIHECNDNLMQGVINGNDECVEMVEEQVMLYRVDDSDDVYGVQIGRDNDGNLQRQNTEGNLEAVPGSIQMISLENDVVEIGSTFTHDQKVDVKIENINQPEEIVKEEHTNILGDNDIISNEDNHDNDKHDEDKHGDIKEDIIEQANVSSSPQKLEAAQSNANSEPEELHQVDAYFDGDPDKIGVNEVDINVPSSYYMERDSHSDEDDCRYTDQDSNQQFGHLFIKRDRLTEVNQNVQGEYMRPLNFHDDSSSHVSEYAPYEDEGESDNETYEDDNVQVTAELGKEDELSDEDVVLSDAYGVDTLLVHKEQEPRSYPKSQQIKSIIRKITINDGHSENKNNGYRAIIREKENVHDPNTVHIKSNPRSILKSSTISTTKIIDIDDERYEKRFARSKEAQQARLFHNYIAQTRIIHAPKRNSRMPRKQKIEPITRKDEEIVVQEVVIASSRFVETPQDGVVAKSTSLKPNEYIQLTDSDEDYHPKRKGKSKRRYRKRRLETEIVISDSDTTSSDPVIEVDTTDEEIQETLVVKKRPRGRPPKNSDTTTNMETSANAPQIIVKRPRGRPPKIPRKDDAEDKIEEITIIIKTTHRCPKCPKSFPSEGSLNSHMKCHIFELPSTVGDKFEDCVNESVSTTNIVETEKPEFHRYICDKCGEMFKNSVLLMRHLNSHDEYCTVCRKYFSSQSELNIHKRVHVKEQMVKKTILPLHKPKKYSIIKRKSPVKGNVKCEVCGRIVPFSLLERHKKFHRKYTCSNCKTEFLSWLLLSKHIATSCVVKRNSLMNTSKLLPNTSKRLSRSSERNNEPVKSLDVAPHRSKLTQSTKSTRGNIKCDSCRMTFATYSSLYKHKQTKHSFKEVGKNLTRKSERLCKVKK